MTIDEVQEMMVPVETLQDRVANRRYPLAITLISQHRGNRIISHTYPEHYAKVVLARHTRERYSDD
jgi:hypothetical protein